MATSGKDINCQRPRKAAARQLMSVKRQGVGLFDNHLADWPSTALGPRPVPGSLNFSRKQPL
jgi:hypothetical protein